MADKDQTPAESAALSQNKPGSSEDSESPESTDKLDRLAGGRTISETAPTIPRGQRGARAAALQALYEEDMTGHPALRSLHNLLTFTKLSTTHAAQAEAIVRAVTANREALDKRLAKAATSFPVTQMATVDRNVLRIALIEVEKHPVGVVINEAVELAKLFGSESSPKFVNGVLGALLR
ncbi:MAG: transcription antitermination factor NusB [Chloroflexi bacterium]|nr:transcription antitermination factor NusB [Chloroflexota bacterium]